KQATEQFLGKEIGSLGCIPSDARVKEAVKRQQPLLLAYPNSESATAIRQIASGFLQLPLPYKLGLTCCLMKILFNFGGFLRLEMLVKIMLNQKLSKEGLNYWGDWQQHRDPLAGEYLVEQYLPLVDYVIQRFMISLPKTVEKDDVRSYAYEGLLDALSKFNIERDLKFETYASWRIKGAIIDGLRNSDWLPRSVRDK